MPRACTICRHLKREEIDQALVADQASLRDIARQWRVSKDALSRHRPHITTALAKAHAAQEVARSDRLLDTVRDREDRAERLYQTTEAIRERALEDKDLRTALLANRGVVDVMREDRALLELRGQLTGELKNVGVQLNVDGRGGQFALVLPFSPQSPPAPSTQDGTERDSDDR